MHILVLGSHGMLGSEFMKNTNNYHNMISGEDIDITSGFARQAIRNINPDMIINCAAYTKVDECEIEQNRCFDVNGFALKTLAEISNSIKAKLIHFSTDYVFNGFCLNDYDEDDYCNPINVYGMSKRLGEYNLINYSNDYLLIRTSWLYGKYGNNFVKTIIDKAQNNIDLTVVEDQIGSPTYTKDLVQATLNLLQFKGIFHITNSGSCSWFEFAETLLNLKNLKNFVTPIKSWESARAAKRPQNSILCCSKYNHFTNTKMRHWKDALKEYLTDLAVSKETNEKL
jgi:dTDP-4-dehydrorhamnose reductase